MSEAAICSSFYYTYPPICKDVFTFAHRSPTFLRFWINSEKARYYLVVLDPELFGDWTLIKVWGASARTGAGSQVPASPSRNAGLEEIERISQRRSRRGYSPVASH
jgi:hypothetical protein